MLRRFARGGSPNGRANGSPVQYPPSPMDNGGMSIQDALLRLEDLGLLLEAKEAVVSNLKKDITAGKKAAYALERSPAKNASAGIVLRERLQAAEMAAASLTDTSEEYQSQIDELNRKLEDREGEIDKLRRDLRSTGGKTAAQREVELLDALEAVTEKHKATASQIRSREAQCKGLQKELESSRREFDLIEEESLEEMLAQLTGEKKKGRGKGRGRGGGGGGIDDEDSDFEDAVDAAKKPVVEGAPAYAGWLWKLLAVVWVITAAALAAAVIALVASLMHAEGLADRGSELSSELKAVKLLRDRAKYHSESVVVTEEDDEENKVSEDVCKLLCPNLNCEGYAHSGEEHEEHQDLSTPKTRVLAALIAVLLLLGPWAFFKYSDYLPSRSPHPLSKRISYRLDIWFSENSNSKPLALLILTALLVGIGTSALFAASGGTIQDELWMAVAGVGIDWTFAGDEDRSTVERLVALFVSLGGMLVTALMLGIVSDTIGEKMDELRKGTSEVLESGHILILGWSDKLLPIIKQLSLAHAASGGGTVVVLADLDKDEMDGEVQRFIEHEMGDNSSLHVICRRGSPILVKDLIKVSVRTAKSVIVLSEADNEDTSDARALRIVLSLAGIRDKLGMQGHVVVEVNDLTNEPLMRLIGGADVETVVSHDVIGRLMLVCARQPGLAFVFDDLMGFQGCEFHKKMWPKLVGRRFGDVLRLFPTAVPCGVSSHAHGFKMRLNPPDDYELKEGDMLLVIAEDEESYGPTGIPAQVHFEPLPSKVIEKKAEKVLFCGWRRDMADLVQHMDEFVPKGSQLWIFCDVPEDEREDRFARCGFDPRRDLQRLKVMHEVGDPVSRKDLEMLPLETFDSALILSSGAEGETSMLVDSRSLATLLLVRDIQTHRHIESRPELSKAIHNRQNKPGAPSSWIGEMRKHAARRCEIISQILDTRSRNLIAETRICDFVLSNELISKTLAMVAMDKHINAVLGELFRSEGNEIYIRPASQYIYPEEDLSYFEVMARVRQCHEILIGWRCGEMPRALINPEDKYTRRTFSPSDILILLGDQDRDHDDNASDL